MPRGAPFPVNTPDETSASLALSPGKPLLRGRLHLGGLVVFLVLGPYLVTKSSRGSEQIALGIYAFAMIAMFGVSASYHRGRVSDSTRRLLRRADHLTIFVAIAGTYTAVALTALTGWAEVLTLCLVWGGAAIGVAVRQLWLEAPKRVVALPYLLVGWSALAVLPQLERGLGPGDFALIMIGGGFYSFGALVYARRRPDPIPKIFGFHELFHACTLVGALLQYCAIAQHVH
jgi:hemolysin III